jgi:type IV secretion system protein VirD4
MNANAHDPYTLDLATKAMVLGWVRGANGRKRYLRYDEDTGLMLFAPPGKGKSTDHIIPTLLTNIQSMFVNDPKGELALTTARRRYLLGHKVFILNPFGIFSAWPHVDMTTARFNPMSGAGMRPDHPNFAANIGVMGSALILPDGGQSYWVESGRKLVNGVAAYACTLPEDLRNLVTVNEIIQSRGDNFVRAMHALDACGLDIARDGAAPYLVEHPPRSVWENPGDHLNAAWPVYAGGRHQACVKRVGFYLV